MKIRKSSLLYIIISIFIFYFLGLNTHNYDYYGYSHLIFNDPFYWSNDKAFIKLILIVKYFLLPYQTIPIIISLLIIFTIKKIKKILNIDVKIFFLLYFIFPFVMDIIQLRNTIICFLFFNVILELSENNKKKALTYVLISIFFQKIAILYLLFIVIYLFYGEKYLLNKKYLLIKLILIFLIMYIFKEEAKRIIPRLSFYLREVLGIKNFLQWGLIFILNHFIIYFFKNKIKYKSINKIENNFLNIVENLNYFNILCLNIMLFFEEFTRIGKNFIPLLYLYGAVSYKYSKDKKILFILFSYALVFLGLYMYLGIDLLYVFFGY